MEHNLLTTYKEVVTLYKEEDDINLKYTNKQMAYMIDKWLGMSDEQIDKDLTFRAKNKEKRVQLYMIDRGYVYRNTM